jgi:Zn-dependent peptidase ImmA (M78 family)
MNKNYIDILNSEIQEAVLEKRDINVENLISKMGIELDKKAELDDALAGLIECVENNRYKISTNKNDNYFRKRITMAHELAHFLFHKSLIGDGIFDNKAYRALEADKFSNQNIKPEHEAEANKFAATILMPMNLIKALCEDSGFDIDKLNEDEISKLATKLKVSKQALAIRLKNSK